ncbi:PE family protein [Mycolicibacterium rhodesiae JS60]|nr:PE family protein [Mycolicibacterium rhodesiae JS60]
MSARSRVCFEDFWGIEMATATTKIVKRGPHRTLGVRTWLGAGALTLGVGAALAGATAVAQADTGGHAASSSTSSSSSSASDAGPQRKAGVASTKRMAPVAKVANARPAAASKSAVGSAQTNETTQTINTPFGPITVSISATVPDLGESGPVSVDVNASTPLGRVKFGLAGNEAFTAPTQQDPTAKVQFSLTEGTLVVPKPVAFLVSSAGSAVLGATSAFNSANAFFTAVQHGNIIGAARAFLEGGPKMANAVLFGQESLTLPINFGQGEPAQVSIPFGGFFAPLRPVSVTWPGYSYVDETTGAEVTIDPVDVDFEGTQFGGVVGAFGQLIGLL